MAENLRDIDASDNHSDASNGAVSDGGIRTAHDAVEAYRSGMAAKGTEFLQNVGVPKPIADHVANETVHGRMDPTNTGISKLASETADALASKIDNSKAHDAASDSVAAARRNVTARRNAMADNVDAVDDNASDSTDVVMPDNVPSLTDDIDAMSAGSAVPSITGDDQSSGGLSDDNNGKKKDDPVKSMTRAAKIAGFIIMHIPQILAVIGVIYLIFGIATCTGAMSGSSNEPTVTEDRRADIPTVALGNQDDSNQFDNQSVGDAIAQLAVYMAATASPEGRIQGPRGDPWEDNGDPRIDNLVTIVDATLGAWGGNDAYASCCQAACAVVAGAADPDIAPSDWPGEGNESADWESGMGGSAGPVATEWYCEARSDLYEDLGYVEEGELEPGDILISATHVMLYVGTEAAQERFPSTDANIYEASFADGPGGDLSCYYAGLTHRNDMGAFHAFRIKRYNTSAAHEILDWKAMLGISDSSGGGGTWQTSEDVNAKQQALLDACQQVGFPGPSLCATWVSRVFAKAFGGYISENGNGYYRRMLNPSKNKGDLRVGMVIACEQTSTKMGKLYGHVGIYVGDGMVMHSTSDRGVVVDTVDRWIELFPAPSPSPNEYGWGWYPGYVLE